MTVSELLRGHPLLAGLTPEQVGAVESCAPTRLSFKAGKRIIEEGDVADGCYFIIGGDVAIELCSVGLLCTTVQTLHAGDLIGWSWLVSPHRWSFDAVARNDVDTLRLDAGLLRLAMQTDAGLGCRLTQRFCELMSSRLEAMNRALTERLPESEHGTMVFPG